MPHLPKAESAAFTGPENPIASANGGDRAEDGHRHSSADPDLAGLGRVVQLVRVEEEPDPESRRDRLAIMRPADARLLLSVGAPSPCALNRPLGSVERAAFVVTPSRAERARADVPDRRVGTGTDLA